MLLTIAIALLVMPAAVMLLRQWHAGILDDRSATPMRSRYPARHIRAATTRTAYHYRPGARRAA